ncbi:hypothetical protein BIV25_25700 [Streptomyces sp. MUSC 14]|uniref:hypothetical protein n=1 Tax=Streptomyces sp. MUSC 14 TaxID=1354889 RepID=UPI0008F5E099|nr:hypothetical protein [Streptomyces sp. MUSC 14]OIJ93370.1 hypothetical protein BIV25_25700 [Streptomyces sp. MUSC 14]
MSQDQVAAIAADAQVEKTRARYGLFAIIASNLAIVVVASVGVWRLHGDRSVVVGILTAAFTAVSSMTTAYLGIKAISNTAKSLAQQVQQVQPGSKASTPATSSPAAVAAPAQPAG